MDVEGSGELWAMTLDAKRDIRRAHREAAPDERTRDAVLSNRVYQELSSAVAGSQEYMAMEKLYELHQDGRYDLLVLDTPPTRSALDFLEAPQKLAAFIDSRALRVFPAARTRLRAAAVGGGSWRSRRGHQTRHGFDLLEEPGEFSGELRRHVPGVPRRAERVGGLSRTVPPRSLLVTSPRLSSIDRGGPRPSADPRGRVPLGAVIVNRMHRGPPGRDDRGLGCAFCEDLARSIEVNLTATGGLAERDARTSRCFGG